MATEYAAIVRTADASVISTPLFEAPRFATEAGARAWVSRAPETVVATCKDAGIDYEAMWTEHITRPGAWVQVWKYAPRKIRPGVWAKTWTHLNLA